MKEAYKQLNDREVYEEVSNDSNVSLNTIMKVLEKIRLCDVRLMTLSIIFMLTIFLTYCVEQLIEFDETTFKQKRGTATGTNFAPPYTILFMADLEEKMFEILRKTNSLVEVHRWHFLHLGA